MVLPRRTSDKAWSLYLQRPSCAVGRAGQAFGALSDGWDVTGALRWLCGLGDKFKTI